MSKVAVAAIIEVKDDNIWFIVGSARKAWKYTHKKCKQ
jgi:hypothetical protein